MALQQRSSVQCLTHHLWVSFCLWSRPWRCVLEVNVSCGSLCIIALYASVSNFKLRGMGRWESHIFIFYHKTIFSNEIFCRRLVYETDKIEPMRLKGRSDMKSYLLFPKLEAPLMSLEEFSFNITG